MCEARAVPKELMSGPNDPRSNATSKLGGPRKTTWCPLEIQYFSKTVFCCCVSLCLSLQAPTIFRKWTTDQTEKPNDASQIETSNVPTWGAQHRCPSRPGRCDRTRPPISRLTQHCATHVARRSPTLGARALGNNIRATSARPDIRPLTSCGAWVMCSWLVSWLTSSWHRSRAFNAV